MKNKIIRQIAFAVISSVLVVSCCLTKPVTSEPTDSSNIDTIPNFFDKNVVLATGIDFNTGESVVLNPINGESINPLTDSQQRLCNQDSVIVNTDGYTRQNLTKQSILKRSAITKNLNPKLNECNTHIVNPNQELTSAINSSEKIINGTVRHNGKDLPARFVVSVTALFEGSNCAYYISGGKQFRFCADIESNCNIVAPVINSDQPRYAASGNESYRRAVRKVCRQFTAWKNNDCNYLRTRYKTIKAGMPPGSNYSNRYKQYIWKTCNFLKPPTWGECPAPVSEKQAISECIKPIETP